MVNATICAFFVSIQNLVCIVAELEQISCDEKEAWHYGEH